MDLPFSFHKIPLTAQYVNMTGSERAALCVPIVKAATLGIVKYDLSSNPLNIQFGLLNKRGVNNTHSKNLARSFLDFGIDYTDTSAPLPVLVSRDWVANNMDGTSSISNASEMSNIPQFSLTSPRHNKYIHALNGRHRFCALQEGIKMAKGRLRKAENALKKFASNSSSSEYKEAEQEKVKCKRFSQDCSSWPLRLLDIGTFCHYFAYTS